MDIRYHYKMDRIRRGKLQLIKIPTEDTDAEFRTKPLRPTHFMNNVEQANMLTLQYYSSAPGIIKQTSSRGGVV